MMDSGASRRSDDDGTCVGFSSNPGLLPPGERRQECRDALDVLTITFVLARLQSASSMLGTASRRGAGSESTFDRLWGAYGERQAERGRDPAGPHRRRADTGGACKAGGR